MLRLAWAGLAATYNMLQGRRADPLPVSDLPEWNEVIAHAKQGTDINDHLGTLFTEALSVSPTLIVELGVRGGESTFVLERVARVCRSKLVSVDIQDCLKSSSYEDWSFVQKDDIAFADMFPEWCYQRGLEPRIDVLFIDTSHRFAHTLEEIRSWFPYLSARSIACFHDTNSRRICFKKDGRIHPIINKGNGREVIHALEVYFNRTFNEQVAFTDVVNGWLIGHYPYCYGLTIVKKLSLVKAHDR